MVMPHPTIESRVAVIIQTKEMEVNTDCQSKGSDLHTRDNGSEISPASPSSTISSDMDTEPSLDVMLAKKCLELRQLQKTHDEYVHSSCEYERELEIEVDRYEKQTHQLEQNLHVMEKDKLALAVKMEELKAELEVTQRREQLMQTQAHEMKWKIQRLEQTNDELETAARIAQATIEDLQHKLETALEQNVFLLHEKEENEQRQGSGFSTTELKRQPSSLMPRTSFRFSRRSSSHTILENANDDTLTVGKSKKKKGQYPDVVETCLHMTCRKCRANKPHHHHNNRPGATSHQIEERKSHLGFFERLRLRLFGRRDRH